jgi:hypothetical protein
MASYQLPDGRTVSTDMAFTLGEVQYPDNWLLFSTAEDRKALGITGPLAEPDWYDQRFYWAPNDPKDHTQLVEEYVAHVRRNASSLLGDTDWMIIREVDDGTQVPADIKAWRQQIRVTASEKIKSITSTQDTAKLASYVTSGTYSAWPVNPVSNAGA